MNTSVSSFIRLDDLTNQDASIDVFSSFNDALDCEKMIQFLKPRESDIIRKRFGIGYPEMTLEEISKIYGVGSAWIQVLEIRAMKKLRKLFDPKTFKAFRIRENQKRIHQVGV